MKMAKIQHLVASPAAARFKRSLAAHVLLGFRERSLGRGVDGGDRFVDLGASHGLYLEALLLGIGEKVWIFDGCVERLPPHVDFSATNARRSRKGAREYRRAHLELQELPVLLAVGEAKCVGNLSELRIVLGRRVDSQSDLAAWELGAVEHHERAIGLAAPAVDLAALKRQHELLRAIVASHDLR